MSQSWVYILASGKNGTLYVSVTNDMARRAYEYCLGIHWRTPFLRRHARAYLFPDVIRGSRISKTARAGVASSL